jgi:hypothetical protein
MSSSQHGDTVPPAGSDASDWESELEVSNHRTDDRRDMFAIYVLLQPWRWLWLPRLTLVRSWLCVGFVVLCVHYEPFWVRFWIILLYIVWAYVRTVNKAWGLM